VLLICDIYEVRGSDYFMWLDVRTKFHEIDSNLRGCYARITGE
jgi:hypothetical protein